MAYTRIHAIKSTVTKAVAYICNPDKTEQQLLVDSFGCSPETARHDFDYALSRTKQSDKNQAYHLIQSFAKGEVSHEEAHRIGIDESNYKPNHFAQHLKNGYSFKIGILIPYLDSGAGYWKLVHSGFLEGIQSIYPFNMELEFRYFDRSIPGDLYEFFTFDIDLILMP